MSKSWIFLRGLGRCSEHWGPFVQTFREQFPGDQIEVIDTAGNGAESSRASFTSIPKYVDDLRNRSKLLKTGKVNLISISMGSMMAVDWADRFPHEIESVTLINTSSNDRSHFYERLRLHNIPSILDSLTAFSAVERERKILNMTAHGLKDIDSWAQTFSHIQPTSKMNLIRQILAASKYKFPKEKPNVPILMLSSLADQFVDPACSERIALAWNLPHFKHLEAGHDIPIWDPQWVAARIAEFTSGESKL